MGKVKVANAQEHKVKVATVQEHNERIIETETNIHNDKKSYLDLNQRFRVVIKDGQFGDMKTTYPDGVDLVKHVTANDILYFAAYSPNEFDEFVQLLHQALEETDKPLDIEHLE